MMAPTQSSFSTPIAKLILALSVVFSASTAVSEDYNILKNESEALGYSVAWLGGVSDYIDRDRLKIHRPDLNGDGEPDLFVSHRGYCGSRGCSGVNFLKIKNGYCVADDPNDLIENSWTLPKFEPLVCKKF